MQHMHKRESTYGRDMVDIWLLHHGAHGVLDRAIGEFVICVLLPDTLQVEKRPVHLGLEELQVSRMRDRVGRIVKVVLAGAEPLLLPCCNTGVAIFFRGDAIRTGFAGCFTSNVPQ